MKNVNLGFEQLEEEISYKFGRALENMLRDISVVEGFKMSLKECLESGNGNIEICLEKGMEAIVDHVKETTLSNIDLVRDGLKKSLFILKLLKDSYIEKELLQKENDLIKNIIFSKDNIDNWEKFSEKILRDLRSIFDFHFFFGIFKPSEDMVKVHLMCFADIKDINVIKKEVLKIIRMFTDTKNTKVKWINRHVGGEEVPKSGEIYIKFREFLPEFPNVGGVLGIGKFIEKPLLPKEKEAVNFIISLMSLIIGSSKALSTAISELEFLAERDALTELFNRRVFDRFLNYEITRAKRKGYRFSLMMIDLDNFKYVNDAYGHHIGDLFLKEVASVLKQVLREGDVVARIGGDEFGVILSETPIDKAKQVAQRILKAFNEKKVAVPDGNLISIRASIGVVEFPTHGTTSKELTRAADLAMYKAKDMGKNMVVILDPQNIKYSLENQSEKYRLILRSIDEDRLMPFFQPIFNIEDHSVIGYEVLSRLIDHEGYVTSASRFIDMAERLGTIRDIDRIIIRKALEQKVEANFDKLLFINLSGREIKDKNFMEYIANIVEEYKVKPEEIVFEITEKTAVDVLLVLQDIRTNLTNKGFKLAIDDFGSGYSSFYYLKYIPASFVKIDGEFIKELYLGGEKDIAFVESIQFLCSKLNIKTIAECVENKETLEILKKIGINYAQGFYLGMPVEKLI